MSENEIVSHGMNISADFCLVRKKGGDASFYLIKNGTSFTSGTIGFQSDQKATVYAKGTEGTIISQGAKIKLMGAGMKDVKFTPSAEVISSGTNFIEVKLAKGMCDFK